jgi:hypothetical protein
MKLGYYGVMEASHKFDIKKSKKELLQQTVSPGNKIRQKGGGRKKPVLISSLLEVLMLALNVYTAKDPMKTNVLWTI